jgi:hypothetical protein
MEFLFHHRSTIDHPPGWQCGKKREMWIFRWFDTGGEVKNPSYVANCITFLKGEVRV